MPKRLPWGTRLLAIGGAASTGLPRSIQPALPTLTKEVTDDRAFLHEIKFDGYRLLMRLDNGSVRLASRHDRSWTTDFRAIAERAARLPARQAWLDGEVVALDPTGRPSFQLLQQQLGQRNPRFHYYAFDLLYLDGYDLRGAKLIDRKALLADFLKSASDPIRLCSHLVGHGREYFSEACRLGLEGIVSKRLDSRYVGGRTGTWRKVKCERLARVLICGFTHTRGSQPSLGSVLLGQRDAHGDLHYVGRLRTFPRASQSQLIERLANLLRPTSPLTAGLVRHWPGVHWAHPRIEVEVAFIEWTARGKLRLPSFRRFLD
jgi:bifunctional non-homologous end joining protein LigD